MRLNETRHCLKIKSKMNDANFMKHFSNRRCHSHDEPLTGKGSYATQVGGDSQRRPAKGEAVITHPPTKQTNSFAAEMQLCLKRQTGKPAAQMRI